MLLMQDRYELVHAMYGLLRVCCKPKHFFEHFFPVCRAIHAFFGLVGAEVASSKGFARISFQMDWKIISSWILTVSVISIASAAKGILRTSNAITHVESTAHARHKRALPSSAFPVEERAAIVDAHNFFRRKEFSSNMQFLVSHMLPLIAAGFR